MPATHQIDEKNRLIVTSWEGEPSVQDLFNALRKYQKEIKSKSEYQNFDELVDFSKIEGFRLRSKGLRLLSHTASTFDKSTGTCKLAFIVSTTLAFGLARMYEIYRSFSSKNKEIRVFRDKPSALNWLGSNNNST